MDAKPIFIHSLFRAASTYFFQVFRRSSADYCCYQEPLHEIALIAKDDLSTLLHHSDDKMAHLRHPELAQPYFQELYEIAPKWMDVLKKEAIYENYFGLLSAQHEINYFLALIENAKGLPVIQECRTSNRIQLLKSGLGGVHLYLCRNPWDQWWSYKTTDYFDAVNQLIVNLPVCPPVIQRLRTEYSLKSFNDELPHKRIEAYQRIPLNPETRYAIFYTLWCLALDEAIKHADLIIKVDNLSGTSSYKDEIQKNLNSLGITDIDISDCSIPRAYFDASDKAFFQKIEARVHGLLLLSGWTHSEVDFISSFNQLQTSKKKSQTYTKPIFDDVLRDAARARELVLRLEQREEINYYRLENALNTSSTQLAELTNSLDLSNQRTKDLESQIEIQTQVSATCNEQLNEKLTLSKMLKDELDAERARSNTLAGELAVAKSNFERLNQELQDKIGLLASKQEALAQNRLHAEWLEGEWNSTKSQIETLAGDLALTKSQNELFKTRISESNQSLADIQIELQAQKELSASLQNECSLSKIKLEELDRSNHHWHHEAHRINAELQGVYHSKSWRLTLPLRLLSLLVQKIFRAISQIPKFIWRIIKAPFKYLLLIFLRYALQRPNIKNKALAWVRKQPLIEAHLRQFAFAHGIIHRNSVLDQNLHFLDQSNVGLDFSDLTPTARQFYHKLQKAIDQQSNENGRDAHCN